jgi:hypothetical protein
MQEQRQRWRVLCHQDGFAAPIFGHWLRRNDDVRALPKGRHIAYTPRRTWSRHSSVRAGKQTFINLFGEFIDVDSV